MLDFIVLVLATWRVCALFSYERGPFNIFMRFRELIGFTHNKDYEPIIFKENFVTSLFECVWCLSVWFAIIVVILYQLWPGETLLVCMPFAISAAVIVIERIVRG
jgi:hypothetical protein